MAKLKLSPKYQAEVDHSCQMEGGDKPFLEYYKNEQECYLEPRKKRTDEAKYEHLSRERYVATRTSHMLKGMPQMVWGYAKRLAQDSPQELAHSASLYTRLEFWHGTQDRKGECQIDYIALLRALAAGDTYVVQQVAKAPPETYKWGSYETKFVVTSILAASQKDDSKLATAIEEYQRITKPKLFVTYMYNIFRAMLNHDASLAVEGLESLLKTSRKIYQLWEICKIISLETHGMYELCRWYDSDLVQGFNIERKLPWDTGLCDWVRQNEGKPTFHDVSQLSPALQQWLEELPLGNGRDHFWPGGVSESDLLAEVAPQPQLRQTPPSITFNESWSTVLTKHAKPEDDDIYDICDTLFGNETGISSYGTMIHDCKLPTGQYSAPRGPWAVCLSREQQPWFLVDGVPVDDTWIKKNGKRKRTQTIYTGYDAEKPRVFFRMYETGKIHVDFVATGHPNEPCNKLRLKSQVPLDDLASEGKSPAAMLDALLKRFDAREMLLQVIETNGKLRLEWQDGSELAPAMLRDSNIIQYYKLKWKENLGSDLLDEAIGEGNPSKVNESAQLGADLEWLPLSNDSPLIRAVERQRGDWKGCVQALLEAGAPINGYRGEVPPISACFARSFLGDAKGLCQAPANEAIEFLLSLGADLHATDSTHNGAGNTPLHHAADCCKPLIVAYLLSVGADTTKTNDVGQTAMDLANHRAENYYAEAKVNAEQIVGMLTDWQSGKLSPEGLKQVIAAEQARNQKAIEDDVFTRAAKLVLMQSEQIEITPLPDYGDPEHAKAIVTDLELCGFVKFGYFSIRSDAVKLRVIGFHHSERNIYALVIIVGRGSFCNLMRFHRNETACDVANTEFSSDFSSRAEHPDDLPIRYYVVQDGNVSQLLECLDSIPLPAAGLDPVRPEEFPERMRRHHELDVEGQHRIAKQILAK